MKLPLPCENNMCFRISCACIVIQCKLSYLQASCQRPGPHHTEWQQSILDHSFSELLEPPTARRIPSTGLWKARGAAAWSRVGFV